MRPGRKQSPVPPLSLRQARIAAGIGPILAAGIAVALVALLAGRPALAGRPTNVAERPSASVSYGDWITASVTATVAAGQAQALPAGPQPRFERISTADGLSFPIVRDILQDRQGYVWFATDSGLNRYDGYEFTVYKHDPGDPTTSRSDYVRAIYEDRDGILWIGGGGGLDRFDRRTETFTHVDTRGQVFSIYEDGAGTLWVGFWHGLYGYDRATGEIIHSRQPDPGAPGDLRVPSRRSMNAREGICGSVQSPGCTGWIGRQTPLPTTVTTRTTRRAWAAMSLLRSMRIARGSCGSVQQKEGSTSLRLLQSRGALSVSSTIRTTHTV
jgi:hypothetical protein